MLKVFAVRDVKADAFGNLITVPTKGLATRAFADACADSRSPMAQYPEDYTMYEIGVYDPNSGTIKGHALPELVMTAVEAIASGKKVAAEVAA
jgi:hypothetical protein